MTGARSSGQALAARAHGVRPVMHDPREWLGHVLSEGHAHAPLNHTGGDVVAVTAGLLHLLERIGVEDPLKSHARHLRLRALALRANDAAWLSGDRNNALARVAVHPRLALYAAVVLGYTLTHTPEARASAAQFVVAHGDALFSQFLLPYLSSTHQIARPAADSSTPQTSPAAKSAADPSPPQTSHVAKSAADLPPLLPQVSDLVRLLLADSDLIQPSGLPLRTLTMQSLLRFAVFLCTDGARDQSAQPLLLAVLEHLDAALDQATPCHPRPISEGAEARPSSDASPPATKMTDLALPAEALAAATPILLGIVDTSESALGSLVLGIHARHLALRNGGDAEHPDNVPVVRAILEADALLGIFCGALGQSLEGGARAIKAAPVFVAAMELLAELALLCRADSSSRLFARFLSESGILPLLRRWMEVHDSSSDVHWSAVARCVVGIAEWAHATDQMSIVNELLPTVKAKCHLYKLVQTLKPLISDTSPLLEHPLVHDFLVREAEAKREEEREQAVKADIKKKRQEAKEAERKDKVKDLCAFLDTLDAPPAPPTSSKPDERRLRELAAFLETI